MFPTCDLWIIPIKTVTCLLTQALTDYSWDDIFQDFTVGVQCWACIHLQKPDLGKMNTSQAAGVRGMPSG